MWHVSVALQGPRGPIIQKLWGSREHEIARALMRQLLAGVGTGVTKIGVIDPELTPYPTVALHAKRVLSESEKAQLTQEWCALPAIDQEGGITLETVEW